MFRAFVIGMLSAIVVLAGAMPSSAVAQTSPNLRAISVQAVDGSRDVKLPDISANTQNVFLSGSARQVSATGWRKAPTAQSFGAPVDLGPSSKNSQYANTAVSALPD